jgi:hypothetical protein
MTTIKSAVAIVDNRCAITIVVRPFDALFNASCTIFSEAVSKAEVASSNRRICGFLIIARAIAILKFQHHIGYLCFCPPESIPPEFPTLVSTPSGRVWTNSHALAFMHASFTLASCSYSDIPSTVGRPRRMFFLMVVSKSTGSWDTMPICWRNHLMFRFRMSTIRLKLGFVVAELRKWHTVVIQEDRPRNGVVKTLQELDNSRLAGPRGAHQRYRLSRLHL